MSRRSVPTALAVFCFVALFCAGCQNLQIGDYETPAYYHPANISYDSLVLPPSVKRVALLPLTTGGSDASLQDGVDALTPIVDAELKKTGRFEVLGISPAQLRQLTGQASWRAEDILPMDFFQRLQRDTGCDAIMFCQVTRYRAFPPLAIGWKFCLAAQGSGEKAVTRNLWSADEVVDASNPKIAHAARTYYSQHLRGEQTMPDATTILRAPSQFAQFSVSAIFSTLPDRPGN